jgi:integrase
MSGKQAKILSLGDVSDLLVFATCTRHPLRNRVIVLLAAKAGLRASEIASLTWDMVLNPIGDVGSVVELHDHAAKNGSGRLIPAHPDLRDRRLSQSLDRHRTYHSIRARWANDATKHRGLVQPRISQRRSQRLLISFRTPDVHHPGGAARPQGRWFVARCPVARRSPLNSNHPTLHRRRQRCAAQARRNDLTA